MSSNNQTSIADPSATYCAKAGYEFKIMTSPDGSQYGICKLPSGLDCDSWKFFEGQCGQQYSYCEQHGGNITSNNSNCKYSSECAVCILPNGTKCDEWTYSNGGCI